MTTCPPARPATFPARQLQAAAAALAAGEFCEDGTRRRPRPAAASWRPDPPLVRVLAANAGAGASTIALALADAAATHGPVRLLDAATPAWSGLLGATATELGASNGWRRGRRGEQVVIDRLEDAAATPADVPAPRDHEHPTPLTVLDVGWSHRELRAARAGWLRTAPASVDPASVGVACVDVLVTRVGAAALGQAELVLTDTLLEDTGLQGTGLAKTGLEDTGPDACLVVVVGAHRWGGPEFASAGPRLRLLRERGAIVYAPQLGVRALDRLGPDPLPRPLMASAQRLLDRITTLTGPLRADHDQKGTSWA